jgi:hypothetical protein
MLSIDILSNFSLKNDIILSICDNSLYGFQMTHYSKLIVKVLK